MAIELHRAALREFEALLRTILGVSDEETFSALLDAMGWDFSVLAPVDLSALIQAASKLEGDLDKVREALQKPGLSLIDTAMAFGPLAARVPEIVAAVHTTNFDPTVPADAPGKLAEDLLQFILMNQVGSRLPRAGLVLELLGIVTPVDRPAILTGGGHTLRRATKARQLDLAAVGRAASDPIGYVKQRFLQDGQGAWKVVSAAADLLGPVAARHLIDMGLSAGYGVQPLLPSTTLTAGEAGAALRMLVVDAGFPDNMPPLHARAILELTDAVPAGDGLGLVVALSGDVAVSIPVGAGTITARAGGATDPILISRSGIRPATGTGAAPAVDVGVAYQLAPVPGPAVVFGSVASTHFQIARIDASVDLVASPSLDLSASLAITGMRLALASGGGDGFLQKMLPADAMNLDGDIAFDWSMTKGLRVRGQAGFERQIASGVQFGPVTIVEALLRVRISDTQLGADLTGTIALTLGPLSAVVEGMGLGVRVRPAAPGPSGTAAGNAGPFDCSIGLVPPKGIGAAINSGPVSGGGYLFFDPDEGQYAGALQLAVKVVNLSAIGILSTKMPDGQPGFSFLIVITAEFPPIQLGYGFALAGVGGILGVHRTMSTSALQEGVQNHALDAIMFPHDPVANIQRLISDLRAIFPVAEGRFVLGPMVKITWGPNGLLVIEVALVLSLPSPLNLALIGRLKAALPTVDKAVVVIQLDLAGGLDFDRSEAWFDAAFVDSKIATFPLTGGMAMRLGWGATKTFALAAGGFHPRFAPPTGFPVLQRLGIAIASGDNPRLRLESYFALTSNTLQFGARAELYAYADKFGGRFSVSATAGFDAIVQFVPFSFVADLGVGVDVQRNGTPFLHAQLSATLSGPTPWHACGFVEVQVLVKVRVGFEATIGEAVDAARQTVDLVALLTGEVKRPESWAAVPVADASLIASLRDAAPGDFVVHPLGSIALHQRVLPFGKVINAYGAAAPAGGATMFEVRRLSVGTTTGSADPVFDDFAPAQFDNLTDDEKLSRPAFESMPAGARASVAPFALPASAAGTIAGAVVSPAYKEEVVDDINAPAVATPVAPNAEASAGAFARRAAVRAFEPAPDESRRVGVLPERYVVADADTLGIITKEGDGTSAARCHDAMSRLGGSQGDATVATAQEAA